MPDFTSLLQGLSRRDIGYIIKGIIQKSINSELTNAEISDSDNKTPVLITNSKDVTLMNDIPIQASMEFDTESQFYMPEEADGKDLRIWAKFENAGQLRDHSFKKNLLYSVGATNMPGLFNRYEDNNQVKYEMFSYFNGINQFAYVKDNAEIRLTDLITNSKKLSVFMRMLPLSLARLINTEMNALFTKVDDDQLRYGYGAMVDMKGNIHFYVRHDYRQYHLMVKNAYAHVLTDPAYNSGGNFRFENFNKFNYITSYESLCNIVKSDIPFDDYIFSYVPTTKRMYVTKTNSLSASSVVADSTTISPSPIINVPVQDGKWKHDGTIQTTIYDASGNGHNGTLTNITTGGEWNQDNTLTSYGLSSGNISITFPAITPINSSTEFTVAFWFNPLDELVRPASTGYLLYKGFGGTNSFLLFRGASTNNIGFNLYDNAGAFTQLIFPNACPTANTWYFVVAKWKSGEKMKLYVNNVKVESSTSPAVTLGTQNFQLFRTTSCTKGKIALFRYYNTQISDTVQNDLYYEGYHNPLFPRSENIQQVWDDTPDPILIPYSTVYLLDKMATPVAADYVKLNSLSSSSPFVETYNVADGSSTTDPVVVQYNVPEGTTTGGDLLPFNLIYTCTDSGNSSSEVSGVNNNDATAIQVLNSSSTLFGKKITKAIFYLRGDNSPSGTVRCRIWNASGTMVTELWHNGVTNQTLSAASVNTSEHTAYTFQNLDLAPWGSNSMGVGWRVGILYNNGSSDEDAIMVKRNRSDPRPNEWNDNLDENSQEWDDLDNTDADDLVADIYEGGTGTATTSPWITINTSSQYIISQRFGSSSTMNNKAPTKIELRVKKKAGTTGTLSLQIVTSSGVLKTNGTLATWNIGTDPNITTSDPATGTYNLVWQNLANNVIIGTDEQITLTGGGTLNVGGEVYVQSNKGNNSGGNNYNGSSSYIRKRSNTGSWSTYDSTLDITGKITTGGNDFQAYKRFSNTVIRITTKIVNTTSSLHNKKITRLLPRIKKVGSPTGVITATIRDPNDNIKVQFSSVDLSTIPANGLYNDVEFLNVVHNYFINSSTGSGDKISYEYSGSDSGTNYLEINANRDIVDTLNTITQSYNGNYIDDAQRDLAGKLYTGGEPDAVSRTRVAQSIEHQNSRLKGKKLTRITAFLYRSNTSATGTVYCNIRRGSDDALILTIESKPVTFSTDPAVPTVVTFSNTANSYALGVGDKITIEYNGGSTANYLGVLIRNVVPDYDTVGTINCSYIRKYDEIDYDDVIDTKDLCATMEEGGFMYTPAAGEQPDPTPVNDKDLIILAGNNKLSGFLECLLKEFRIYSKELTLTQATSLHNNRYTISPIIKNEILMPFTFRMVPDA